jgi:hypothetical protein
MYWNFIGNRIFSCVLPYHVGAVVVMIVWYLDIQLPMQPVPITTKVVTSNPVHGEVYSIQHYVIMFVSDLWQVGGFSGFLHQLIWPPQYNWNIVESGVKHHIPKHNHILHKSVPMCPSLFNAMMHCFRSSPYCWSFWLRVL